MDPRTSPDQDGPRSDAAPEQTLHPTGWSQLALRLAPAVLLATLVAVVAWQAWHLRGLEARVAELAAGASAAAPVDARATAPGLGGRSGAAALPGPRTDPRDDRAHDDLFAPLGPAGGPWDPWEEFHRMQSRMNRLFGRSLGGMDPFGDVFAGLDDSAFTPRLDLQEEPDRFVVRIDVPGADEGDVDVVVDGDTLTVSGSRAEELTHEEGTTRRAERFAGRFHRSLRLPTPVDEAEVETDFADGVLTVVLPKAEPGA